MRRLELDDEILSLYEVHESAYPVAEKLGCSAETVYRVLKKHGVPRTHRHPKPEKPKRKLVEIDVAEITRLYEDGNSLMEIGELFGCSWMTVNRRLKAAGVQIRKTGAVAKEEVGPRLSNHMDKARKYGTEYDGSISWRTLSERLGHCNCEICGEPCDPTDKRWGVCGPFYPSVDCIVPMSKGGGYTWDNVQLAHCICNMAKKDLEAPRDLQKVVARYA